MIGHGKMRPSYQGGTSPAPNAQTGGVLAGGSRATRQDRTKSNLASRSYGSVAGGVSSEANCGTSTASDGLRNSKTVSSPQPGRKVTGP